ncbi:MAG: hypothetical protein IID45_13630 [Planctomycetes bacterium]|nr:hypothetical protein [Planctomycetota bacterium]
MIGGTFGGYLNDWLIRWTGNRRWSRSAIGFSGKALASGLMFVAIGQNDLRMAAGALFVVKFFSDWSQPTVWGTCTDLGGRFSASVFGVINTAGSIGGLISPAVFGRILDYNTTEQIINGETVKVTDFGPLFTVIAGMYIVSAVCWFFIDCTSSLEKDLEPVKPKSENGG